MAEVKLDPDVRRKALFAILAAVVFGILVIGFVLPEFFDYLNSREIEDALLLVQIVLVVMALPLVVAALILFSYGRRIVAARTFPPPGWKVVRNTETVTGRQAAWRGYLFFAMGAVALAGAIVLGAYMPYVLARLVQDHQQKVVAVSPQAAPPVGTPIGALSGIRQPMAQGKY